MPTSYSEVQLLLPQNYCQQLIINGGDRALFALSFFVILNSFASSYAQVLDQLKEKALKRAGLKEEHVLQRIQERTDARNNKEYERSDSIRKDLAKVGIALMDSPEGTTWRPAIPLALQEPATTI